MLVFDKPMTEALIDFPPTDYLIYEFFSVKRIYPSSKDAVIHPLMALFLGFIPAIVGFFVSIELVVLIMLIAFLVITALVTPEFSMILTLLTLPYISVLPYSSVIIVVMSLLTFLSFAIKVVIGKRVLTLSIYDALIFLIGVFIVIGGALGYGEDSLVRAFSAVAMLLAYFPAKNLVVNRRLADCAVNAIVVSTLPVAIMAIAELVATILGKSLNIVLEYAVFPDYDTLAVYLMIGSVLSLLIGKSKRRRWKKAAYLLVFILDFVAAASLAIPFVFVAAVVFIPLYSIITSKTTSPWLALGVAVLPALLILLPVSILDKVYAAFGIEGFAQSRAAWIESVKLFLENPVFGIGIGEKSYFGASGGELGEHTTVIGIALQTGGVVLALVLSLIFVKLAHLSRYRSSINNSETVEIVRGTVLAVLLLATVAFFTDVFAIREAVYLVSAIFGVCTASVSVAKREHDDRVGYYGAFSELESSAIDVELY